MIFTTSWDDGYARDIQLAKLLDKYGCKGTFYVSPKKQHDQEMLSAVQIKELSTQHEIGAHTMTHPHLTKIPPEQAKKEIADSKEWVEGITDKECSMFCYPIGDCDDRIAQIVREAGYKGARTVQQFAFQDDDPFLLPTTLHVYPFPFRPMLSRRFFDPIRNAKPHLKKMGIPLYTCRNWLRLAIALFQYAHKNQKPWFHLWGHSAEVEKFNMWKDIEAFLKYVSAFEDVDHEPNSALVSL